MAFAQGSPSHLTKWCPRHLKKWGNTMKTVYKNFSAARRFALLACVWLVSLSAYATTPVDTDVVWQAWESKDVSTP